MRARELGAPSDGGSFTERVFWTPELFDLGRFILGGAYTPFNLAARLLFCARDLAGIDQGLGDGFSGGEK